MENLIFNFHTTIFFVVGYLVGSIPFGYLIYKLKNNDDIRNYGSGNIGATNVNRLMGKKLGALTLLLDFFKTFLITIFLAYSYGNELGVICGFFSILGHIFPIWLKFKGGKGVASFLGLLAFISWPLTLLFCMTWLISVKLFKISAAGAMLAIIVNVIIFKSVLIVQFSYNIIFWVPGTTLEFNIILVLSMLVLCKHYSNFKDFFKK